MRPSPRTAIGLAATLVVAAGTAALAAPTLTSSSVNPYASALTLPAVTPAWASVATVAGTVPASQVVNFSIVVRSRDAAGLAAFNQAVATPGNALYRQFLTPAEFKARFSPTTEATDAVRSWLQALPGVTITREAPYGNAFVARATTASLASIFGVRFALLSHKGYALRTALDQPTLPASVANYVQVVDGLSMPALRPDNSCSLNAADDSTGSTNVTAGAGAPPAFCNAPPASTAFYASSASGATYHGSAAPLVSSGYTPDQIRGAYGLNTSPYTGKGATIAIVDAYDAATIPDDLDQFSHLHNLPVTASTTYTDNTVGAMALQNTPDGSTVGLPLPDPQGWSGEETLDFEAAHLMAPAADLFYEGADTEEALEAQEILAVEDGAQVVTNSWGSTDDEPLPADQQTWDTAVTTANAGGVTIAVSSGDDGDEQVAATDPTASAGRAADFPATSAGVTAVGGTTVEIGADNSYLGESYWGTRKTSPTVAGTLVFDTSKSVFNGAGGGGDSETYTEPAYQTTYGVPMAETLKANEGGTPTAAGRVVPDLALLADSTTGMLVGQTQTQASGKTGYSEYRIGGTSVASPLFAGLVADAVEANKGVGFGNLNSAMYAFAKGKAGDGAFRDPALGRVNGAARLGSATCAVADPPNANLRYDYSTTSDPSTSTAPTLRTLGNLCTLDDLPPTAANPGGYDDSTGLGGPYAPTWIADLIGATPPPAPPTTAAPTTTAPASPTAAPTTTASPTAKPTTTPTATPAPVKIYRTTTLRVGGRGPVTPKEKRIYTLRLFVDPGAGPAPSFAGRLLGIYVDNKLRARLLTGKDGMISYALKFPAGNHLVTAVYYGGQDLARSTSPGQKVRSQ